MAKSIRAEDYIKKQQEIDMIAAYGQSWFLQDAFLNWNEDFAEFAIQQLEQCTIPFASVGFVRFGGATARGEETAFYHR